MSNEVYLGLGTNLGNRRENLALALKKLQSSFQSFQISSIYETPALLPENAGSDWNRPFFNLAIRGTTTESPTSLHQKILQIEEEMGRERGERWSPRIIDIDLLLFNSLSSSDPKLTLPHPRIKERAFVLGPLSELNPHLKIDNETVKDLYQKTLRFQPRLMGILNITPDSFSDGGIHLQLSNLEKTLSAWDEIGIPIIDVGADSTRPGSIEIDADEEWKRLEPTLLNLNKRYQNQLIKPKISLDTRHAKTAEKALNLMKIDIINDVGGLQDFKFTELLHTSPIQYVLMHNLPLTNSQNPVTEAFEWMRSRLDHLMNHRVSLSKIILDPGIGFKKNSIQSLKLIQGIKTFQSLGCPVLCGHSRKSFLQDFTPHLPEDRDIETLGVSFALRSNRVEILRVHHPVLHHRAFLAMEHAFN